MPDLHSRLLAATTDDQRRRIAALIGDGAPQLVECALREPTAERRDATLYGIYGPRPLNSDRARVYSSQSEALAECDRFIEALRREGKPDALAFSVRDYAFTDRWVIEVRAGTIDGPLLGHASHGESF